jgi:predicted NAD-dependent protein-ADP-ribosyltransferase YbiA (DUF1768 family)
LKALVNFSPSDIVIRKVREPYGWLSNMSPHSIGLWRTAEHAFQAKRFADTSDVRKRIMDASSPMLAKMIAKDHVQEMIVQPRSERDVANMRALLLLKLEQHPLLREALRATGSRLIVEDCSARTSESGLFWGAARQADGRNVARHKQAGRALDGDSFVDVWCSIGDAMIKKTHSNGKKTSTQLGREVNDILAARQKREAKSSASSALPSRYQTNDPRTGLQRYSDEEYERRELSEARQKLAEVEKAPLTDRKEAAAEFFEAMRDNPAIIAERVGWLLDGNYGYGAMKMAKQVLGSPRMNRSAALTHMIAAFEWQTPNAMAIAMWKKLTKGQQVALEKAVQAEIKSAETAE